MYVSCKTTREAFSDYLDRTLAADQRAGIKAHLDACEGCADALAVTRELVHALGEMDDVELPDGFARRLSARLYQAADEVQRATGDRPRRPERSALSRRLFSAIRSWGDLTVRPLAGVAVAGLLVFAFMFSAPHPDGQLASSTPGPVATPVSENGMQPVHVNMGGEATVRIWFEAARPIDNVRFTVQLPAGVRMVSDGKVVDTTTLTWEGSLEEGVNLVPLNVRGVAKGEWTVSASIEKGNARRQQSVGLLVDGV